MAIYECRTCKREELVPRRFRYHLGPSCRCPLCGTYRVSRLKQPDKIDRKHGGFLNLLERFAGKGRLFHCRWCRLQFFDRRGLGDRGYRHVPTPPRRECRKQRRLPARRNSVNFQVESSGRGPAARQLATRAPAGLQPLAHPGLDQERPCARERRGVAPVLHTARGRDDRSAARRSGAAACDGGGDSARRCCTKTPTWWPSISRPAWWCMRARGCIRGRW